MPDNTDLNASTAASPVAVPQTPMESLLAEVVQEIADDKKKLVKSVLRERLLEVQNAERVLAKLRKQLEDLLAKSIDDVVDAL